jgi:hypothetical protein
MKKKPIEPKHCIFVSSQFGQHFPHLKHYYREGVTDKGIIFDCISAPVDLGNYLHIVAVLQKAPTFHRTLNIWIPTSYIQAVLLEGYDKPQAGFHQTPQDDNGQDQYVPPS